MGVTENFSARATCGAADSGGTVRRLLVASLGADLLAVRDEAGAVSRTGRVRGEVDGSVELSCSTRSLSIALGVCVRRELSGEPEAGSSLLIERSKSDENGSNARLFFAPVDGVLPVMVGIGFGEVDVFVTGFEATRCGVRLPSVCANG
jgi:hypothetical protein